MAKSKEVDTSAQVNVSDLTRSLVEAIELTRPARKETITTRKKNTPWTPKDGSQKLKLKRKMYQHGMLIDPDTTSNEEISLLNKVKPGVYCDGWIKVVRRRDRGIDVDWPIRTAAQRLRLPSQFKLTDLESILTRCIEEAANPKKIDAEEIED